MIKIILLLFIVLLVFTNAKSLLRLIRSYNYLKKYSNYDSKISIKHKIKVIIPAMNEVKNVDRSINYFKKLSKYCDVIYVTTSKEKDMLTYKKITKKITSSRPTNIYVKNCPNTYGTMATQINYVAKTLDSNDVIALYNIDSQPEEKTFQYVLEHIDDSNLLQQVSYFNDDLHFITKSGQDWQNRWSIIYETGRYLSNSKLMFKYCIGHGLFIKKKNLDKYGYLSESEINEDNDFGYRMLINGVKIEPIPFLEKADFAKNAFSYYRNNNRSLKNLLLSILNFKAFISWWLFPIVSYTFLIISFFVNINYFTTILILLINYLTVYNFLCSCILYKFGYIDRKSKVNIINDMLFFAVHSFGSYITIYKLAVGKNNI